jgi:YHS domain-containing protein
LRDNHLRTYDVDHSSGFGRPVFSDARENSCPENMRGRLGHNRPLESVRRVNIQQQIDRWIGRGTAWLVRKLLARILPKVTRASKRPGRARTQPYPVAASETIPLHHDPLCGTYVSPEISFPLELPGQMLHFCSEECRTRYQRSSQRAASA